VKLEREDHVIVFWFIDAPGMDWFCLALRRGDKVHFEYRFRYHSGTDDPFDGSDQKSTWAGSAPLADEEKVIAMCDDMANQIAKDLSVEVDRTVVHGGLPEFYKLFAAKSYVHYSADVDGQ
jgi:hypothetical protein